MAKSYKEWVEEPDDEDGPPRAATRGPRGPYETKLTGKQLTFIDEYMSDMNATQAAKRAGYGPKSAYRTGANLLKHPQIRSIIAERMEERRKKIEITSDWVLQRLLEEAQDDGQNPSTKSGRVKATELLAKYLGLFEADNRQKTDIRVTVTREVKKA